MLRISKEIQARGVRAAAEYTPPWPFTDRFADEYRAGYAAGYAEAQAAVSVPHVTVEIGGRKFLKEVHHEKPPKGVTDLPRVPLMTPVDKFTKADAWWDGYKDGRRVRVPLGTA